MAMLRQLVAGMVVVVMLTSAAVAGPLDDGMAAYLRGDYAEALRLWKPLADQGHASARFNLGLMYAAAVRPFPCTDAEAEWCDVGG